MYDGATSNARTDIGVPVEFPVTFDLHKMPALSPSLLVVDALNEKRIVGATVLR